MGSKEHWISPWERYDGAEVRELVGTCTLNNLAEKHGENNVDFYWDDGVAVFENIKGKQAEKIEEKGKQKIFVIWDKQ